MGSATTLWKMAGGTVFNRRLSANQSAHVDHFTSAVYSGLGRFNLGMCYVLAGRSALFRFLFFQADLHGFAVFYPDGGRHPLRDLVDGVPVHHVGQGAFERVLR